MKLLFPILTGLFIIAVTGCSGLDPVKHGDALLWSNQDERPEWTMETVTRDGDTLLVVGMSDLHSSEKSAREAALLNAAGNLVDYMGSDVTKTRSAHREEKGSDAGTLRASITTNTQETAIAEGLVERLEAKEWYISQWRQKKEIRWVAYVKTEVELPENN